MASGLHWLTESMIQATPPPCINPGNIAIPGLTLAEASMKQGSVSPSSDSRHYEKITILKG